MNEVCLRRGIFYWIEDLSSNLVAIRSVIRGANNHGIRTQTSLVAACCWKQSLTPTSKREKDQRLCSQNPQSNEYAIVGTTILRLSKTRSLSLFSPFALVVANPLPPWSSPSLPFSCLLLAPSSLSLMLPPPPTHPLPRPSNRKRKPAPMKRRRQRRPRPTNTTCGKEYDRVTDSIPSSIR